MGKKQRGRPRKKEGTIEFWRFARAGMVMCAYDEARESGQKHSVAVTQAVDFVKERSPEMPISETEVKRILATFRPRSSRAVLRFKGSILSDQELKKFRWIKEQLASVQGKKGLSVLLPSNENLPKSSVAYTMRYAARPVYLRHNRKTPKE